MERVDGWLGRLLREWVGEVEAGPITRPSSISWCRVTPEGRMMGFWRDGEVRIEVGGLRKKKGWEGRAEESSVMWSLHGVSVGGRDG